MKDKKIIIPAIVILVIAIAVVGYLFFRPRANGNPQEFTPSSYSGTNPLQNKPDLNPTDKINPFKSVKTNPFE